MMRWVCTNVPSLTEGPAAPTSRSRPLPTSGSESCRDLQDPDRGRRIRAPAGAPSELVSRGGSISGRCESCVTISVAGSGFAPPGVVATSTKSVSVNSQVPESVGSDGPGGCSLPRSSSAWCSIWRVSSPVPASIVGASALETISVSSPPVSIAPRSSPRSCSSSSAVCSDDTMPPRFAASIFWRIVGLSPAAVAAVRRSAHPGPWRLRWSPWSPRRYADGISRVEPVCSLPRSASSKYEIDARLADRPRLAGGVGIADCRVTERCAQIQVDATGRAAAGRSHGRLTHQVEIDAVLSAFEIQIDAAAGCTRERARGRRTTDLRARSGAPMMTIFSHSPGSALIARACQLARGSAGTDPCCPRRRTPRAA